MRIAPPFISVLTPDICCYNEWTRHCVALSLSLSLSLSLPTYLPISYLSVTNSQAAVQGFKLEAESAKQ